MERYELCLMPRTALRGELKRRRYLDNYQRRLRRSNPKAEIELSWEEDQVKAVIGGIPMQEALRKWF